MFSQESFVLANPRLFGRRMARTDMRVLLKDIRAPADVAWLACHRPCGRGLGAGCQVLCAHVYA